MYSKHTGENALSSQSQEIFIYCLYFATVTAKHETQSATTKFHAQLAIVNFKHRSVIKFLRALNIKKNKVSEYKLDFS